MGNSSRCIVIIIATVFAAVIYPQTSSPYCARLGAIAISPSSAEWGVSANGDYLKPLPLEKLYFKTVLDLTGPNRTCTQNIYDPQTQWINWCFFVRWESVPLVFHIWNPTNGFFSANTNYIVGSCKTWNDLGLTACSKKMTISVSNFAAKDYGAYQNNENCIYIGNNPAFQGVLTITTLYILKKDAKIFECDIGLNASTAAPDYTSLLGNISWQFGVPSDGNKKYDFPGAMTAAIGNALGLFEPASIPATSPSDSPTDQTVSTMSDPRKFVWPYTPWQRSLTDRDKETIRVLWEVCQPGCSKCNDNIRYR